MFHFSNEDYFMAYASNLNDLISPPIDPNTPVL